MAGVCAMAQTAKGGVKLKSKAGKRNFQDELKEMKKELKKKDSELRKLRGEEAEEVEEEASEEENDAEMSDDEGNKEEEEEAKAEKAKQQGERKQAKEEDAQEDSREEESWVQVVKGGNKKMSKKEVIRYKLHQEDYRNTKVLERREICREAQGVALISPQDLLGIFREGWIRGYCPAKPLTLYVVGEMDAETKVKIREEQQKMELEGKADVDVEVRNQHGEAKVVKGYEWTMWSGEGKKSWEERVEIRIDEGSTKAVMAVTFEQKTMSKDVWDPVEKEWTKGHKEWQKRVNEAKGRWGRNNPYAEAQRAASAVVNMTLGGFEEGVEMYGLHMTDEDQQGKGKST